MKLNPKLVLITPFRDEELFIERTLLSVTQQTVLPIEWIFIDDNSRDSSVKIISRYAKKIDYIRVYQMPISTSREPGSGVIRAFNFGYTKIINKDYDFIGKLDADIFIDQNYFESLFKEFESNKYLGIATGKIIDADSGNSYKVFEEHTYGNIKIYRKSCFDRIMPLDEIKGWDLVDNLKAKKEGFETKVIESLVFYHLKPLDSAVGKIRESYLKGYYSSYLGYLFTFAFIKFVRTCIEKPFLIGGFLYGIGYLKNSLIDRRHYHDTEIISLLREQQRDRIKRLFLSMKL